MAVVVLYTLYYPRREVLFMFIIPGPNVGCCWSYLPRL